MKFSISIIIVFFISTGSLFTQSVTRTSHSSDSKHLVYLNSGFEFGMVSQMGYAYQLKSKNPLWLSIDYSLPFGKNLLDDNKTRIGIQMEVFKRNNFMLTAKCFALVRRYENDFVRMVGFGSELSGTIGYYKTNWFFEAEVGTDKSIITHLRHTDLLREKSFDLSDGWFIPSGGYHYYGLRVGRTIGRAYNLSLAVGKMTAEGKDQDPLLPVYLKLGIQKSI